jgi:hypothetical protein
MQGRAYYSSPVGDLIIESENDKIITVGFLERRRKKRCLQKPRISVSPNWKNIFIRVVNSLM